MPPSAEGRSADGTPADGPAPLRIIQVGAGAMGRAWLHNLAESPDAVVVGLVDLDPGLARAAAADTGHGNAAVAESLDDLLGRVEADAVVNVTVPAAHRAVSERALRAGLPVLCEKPLADTVSSGLSMAAAAELTGQLLMVSQSRRYWRHLDTLSGLLDQLGEIGAVGCTFRKAPRFGGFREQMPYPLLIDMAIHQFDLARVLIHADPIAVYCDSYNPSWSWFRGDASAEAVFEFADGARFAFSGSWCAPGLETSWNGSWWISGANGTATWDGEHAPAAEDTDGHRLGAEPGSRPEQIAGSFAEFAAAVRTGETRPAGEVHSNVLSLAMVEAAIRSAEHRRRVSIAEILDDAYADAIRTETEPDLRDVLASWPFVHDVIGEHRTVSTPPGAAQ
ncbi:Gfo/Idh/MocA family protein [Microlunatus ginsengisoli]|uniref:Gfo/Idh/MocA family oxidoreductase n=1 Tax=Microlunatus ginsengisoli TaxID=363863 RepID=A0ABP6ZRL8_9ACTN